ncbi:MAG: SH3 domain-containing protein, partial [Candidatus Rokuibacteriota bacterium]
APSVHAAVTPPELRPPTNGRREVLEVIVAESVLRPNAVHGGQPVGTVQRGERLTYLDSVDRRLRVFNTVVFDGGHWVKVRAEDGTVGWLPASTVREVR